MLDPFRLSLPSQIEAPLVRFANAAALPSLPQHAHEVLFAIGLYSLTMGVVSPAVSSVLVPKTYKGFDRRTRISWDIHFVSFVQACIVNALSFYLIFYDEERKAWRGEENWEKRIWGYTGMTGFTQSMALGYFLWDLYMCLRYLNIFGWGMVVHAVASVGMFTFGFVGFSIFGFNAVLIELTFLFLPHSAHSFTSGVPCSYYTSSRPHSSTFTGFAINWILPDPSTKLSMASS
jgi:hypothetical protein